ncbi:MAG: UDP-N-acetylmuramate:L-alanyl-gamma-D-glutamyl-meso-diaminopimelate ligase [Verrucomicrobiaceae bacterium]|nr:MAG: UDP-N-acetylmuramate:L-alanyl-gamma-D-glutamyl-meso-diaminopimelate ligase [Verrucomicrobiaceae bacterium]
MSEKHNHFHFIGICGTAMGAVAAAMKEKGFKITGSDSAVYPPISTFLENRGIRLERGYRAGNIPEEADVIVVGNAISRGNEEVEEVLNRKLRYVSMPEVLKEHFLRGRRNFVVTGTHGKTTTTSLLTWILHQGGKDPSYLIGGVPRNFDGGAKFTDGEFFVLEGDEYDTAFFDKRSKFLHYLPEAVIINNIEFDHADIFENLEAIKKSFRLMLRLVPRNGVIFANGDDPNCLDVVDHAPAPVVRVGFGPDNDRWITEVVYGDDSTEFTLNGQHYTVPMNGEYNVRNAAMAVCNAEFAGMAPDRIAEALAAFKGVARRQDLRGEVNGVKVVDDFGHHPTAIRETAIALKRRYLGEGGRMLAIFEPRSNTTRRKVFQNELALALGASEMVILAPVADPHKIPEDDRLDMDQLLDTVRTMGRGVWLEEDVDKIVARAISLVRPGDCIVVFSNGGFGGIHDKLLEALKRLPAAA